jgi:dCMP deaminase
MIWEEYFLDMLPSVAKKSKDNSTKVGCIITGADYGILVTGFNGFARGVNDKIEEVPERYERPAKYLWTPHAEANAIYYAAGVGTALRGGILWVGWHPCAGCADAIINARISKVIFDADSAEANNMALAERWKEDHRIAKLKFAEAKVPVIGFSRKR